MTKLKYQSKILIAEYQYLSKLEDCRFSEFVYRLNDGSKILEYNGGAYSVYGIAIGYSKRIGRKGVYRMAENEFNMWKASRNQKEFDGSENLFVDWEKEKEDQFNIEHENVLKCVGSDDLPF